MTIGDCELDAMVAEAMGYERLSDEERQKVYPSEQPLYEDSLWRMPARPTNLARPVYGLPCFSEVQQRGFAQVKREIEQRGWGWASRYVPSVGKCRFEVIVLPATRGVNNRFKVWAETEELAGCRAFLKACEAE